MNSNPYTPAVETAATSPGASLTQPIYFCGSMSVEEGRQVERLMEGKPDSARGKNGNLLDLTKSQWVSFVAFAIVVVAFAAESIVYDELDQLPSIMLGLLAIVGGIAAVAYYESIRRRRRFRLKADHRGAFTHFSGHLDEHGVEYLVEDFPIRYQWEDFVGCRISTDAAILYVKYPHQINFLTASLLNNIEQWENVTAKLKMHVPVLGRLARLQTRRQSPTAVHVASGMKALNRNDWKTALEEFDSALAVRPNDAQALRGRMVATSAFDDPNKTLDAVDAVVLIGKPDTIVRQIRASALSELGRYTEALDDLDYLIERDDQNPDWWTGRGLAFCKLERFDEAVRDATHAIELSPNNAIALNNRGYARLKLGLIADAIGDLEAAVAMAPEIERPMQLLDEARQLADETA